MGVLMHSFLLIVAVSVLVLDCSALNCRTDSGPKEDQLKKVFQTCARKMDRKSNYSSHGLDSDSYRGIDSSSRPMDRRYGEQASSQGGSRSDDNDNNDRSGNNRNINQDGIKNGGLSQSDESTSEYPNLNGYRSTTVSPRRYKREARNDGRSNSGHRSQYNPNTTIRPNTNNNHGEYGDSFKNASDMNISDKNKACVVHCFLDDLQMTGDNGMPDRYMVTHVITKDIKNEDLKDFLQESIEECFQILYNENTQDKCEFSKNLMMCLSEKGRSNCDDWKEDSFHF